MNLVPSDERQHGFTLVELLVALGIFLVITGAAFSLLGTSQKHYQTESQLLTSFQEARLGLDRSEEHTSELQSRRDLVCRLLLEKKKKVYRHMIVKKKSIQHTIE